MSARLVVTRSDGAQLFDTSLISYGLIRSGYLVKGNVWTRRTLRSINLDPNDGNSWTASSEVDAGGVGDQMWTFTVPNAKSPILFIVGDGCLNGVSVSGTTKTYIYGNASESTKVYAFDLMQDTLTGPHLKIWDGSGTLTFNSLQYPLNIVAVRQAPTPPASAPYPAGYYTAAYINGYGQDVSVTVGSTYISIEYSKVDIALDAQEYAAHITFSRGANLNAARGTYSIVEGAGGYIGGIRFMFGPAGGTPSARGNSTPSLVNNLPIDRYPQALVIRTAGLPFPFN